VWQKNRVEDANQFSPARIFVRIEKRFHPSPVPKEYVMPNIGVILSGCGYLDGSEIQEAVLTMLALDRLGAEMVIMAPDVDQMHVVNHITGQPVAGERRNVLIEAARISRGNIRDIAGVQAAELDALMMPGGFGAAKNLSDFAVKGEGATVNPDVARLIRDMHKAGKWICAVCIAPAIVGRVLQEAGIKGAQLTLGEESQFAEKLRTMGATHVECPVKEPRVDRENRIITTPAYMYGEARIADVATGVEAAAENLLKAIRGESLSI
jgi:enhancing lycopene biosynthesis protein 2